jgi:aminoglycoside phosphotransferase family enzyme/predicted kinase
MPWGPEHRCIHPMNEPRRDAIPAAQGDIADFLARLAGRAPITTHISAVFVGADDVWKLKKAVRLPFLDFSTPASRKHFLLRELALNQPAAPEIYHDVIGIARTGTGLTFCDRDSPAAIEWVLRMAVIPQGDFLDAAAPDAFTPRLCRDLADMVARLHAEAPVRTLPSHHGQLSGLIAGAAAAARAAGLDAPTVSAWQSAILARLDDAPPLLARRQQDNRIRRTHGDLHLRNICLWRGLPVAIDALEFSEELATIDIGYDFAFLLMDLEFRVGRDAANAVFNRYMALSGDLGQLELYPIFLSLRAMIRSHIEAAQKRADAQPYLQAALAYLAPLKAPVVAIGGLPGTGKSTLARVLAPDLGPSPGALVLRSDEIRKRLYGVAPEETLPATAYDGAANRRVAAALLRGVSRAAASGHGVIVDATFRAPGLRDAAAQQARAAGRHFTGLWLEAPLPVLERRVTARHGDASDAGLAVLRAAARIPPGPISWRKLDATDIPLTAEAAQRFLHADALQGIQACNSAHRARSRNLTST